MPLTPYTTNIPLSNQPINQTQQAINDNFTCLVNNSAPSNGLITVNHVGTNDPVNYGKHNFIELITVTPTQATSAAEVALYSKNGPISGTPELFFQNQSLPADSGYSITECLNATNGWTRLPSGILLKWGTLTTTTYNTLQTINFPVGANIPVFTAIYSCQLTVAAAQTDTQVVIMMGTFTTTNVNAFARKLIGVGGTTPFTFFAIGRG